MDLSTQQVLWLFLPSLPVALWVAWSDLKFMKITNKSVMTMVAIFVLFGFIALPVNLYLWRLPQIIVVLAVGFVANALRMIGGGDAKYAAAIAPFFAASDFRLILVFFAVTLLAAFITHRIFKRIGFIRRMTKNWKSWDAGTDFPMGLALSGTLIGYLVVALAH